MKNNNYALMKTDAQIQNKLKLWEIRSIMKEFDITIEEYISNRKYWVAQYSKICVQKHNSID